MQIRVIFALPFWCPLGALGSCPSRLPLDPPLTTTTTTTCTDTTSSTGWLVGRLVTVITALSAQTGYIVPREYEIHIVWGQRKTS